MKLRLAPSIALIAASSFFALCVAHAAKKPPKGQQSAEAAPAKSGAATGWFNWRGPAQNGSSPETGLPDKVDASAAAGAPGAPLWTADFPGQSTAVIANGRLYINGRTGDGADLREGVSCFDADTGKVIWQHFENDFLSDIIYLRYATGAPTIDPETGNVYVQGTQGMLSCFSADGKVLWQHSLMEEYGRMTFPNGRTATPVVDHDLVITRGITSGWGANGPAADRLLAFDKNTGSLVWLSSPADRPQDPTFSPLFLSWYGGKRVFFTACGDSSVACVNARTGEPIYRFRAAQAGAKGGINGGVLRYKDALLVAHESENVDTSEVGRTAAFRIPAPGEEPKEQLHSTYPVAPGMKIFSPKELELWRNPLGNLGSSPALAGNTLYEVTGVGELAAVNADTGVVKWKKKLGAEQRQSSPFVADGKVYVGFYIAGGQQPGGDNDSGDGELYIFKPGEKDAEVLSRTKLTGRCFGSPIGYNGKIYIQTDKKLYAFGKKGDNASAKNVVWKDEGWPEAGKTGATAKLQLIPDEVLLGPGQSVQVRVQGVDANGFTTQEAVDLKSVKIDNYIPPTALVKAKMNGKFDDAGKLTADKTDVSSAGAFQGVLKSDEKVDGTLRGRILPELPIKVDFEGVTLKETTGPGIGNEAPEKLPAGTSPGPTNWNAVEPPTPFAYPPLAWGGARFRFEIRKAPGAGNNLALCKTIDNKRFQRGQVFIGHSDMKNYTIEADVLTEGNKRKMSDIGLINQRYLVTLRGNAREIEVSSNLERIKKTAPFTLTPNEWYHLKVKVDVAKDGSGVVRAKAWKKSEPEPAAWTIEVEHKHAHPNGSPGFFSLSPQEQRAWIDNIEVKKN
ncbi:MAG: PQQ-binding-like beta-propeller repeat protein [Chthoniobacteraceae bacterium]